MGDVLNAMEYFVKLKAECHLQDISQTQTKQMYNTTIDVFVETYEVKYSKEVD